MTNKRIKPYFEDKAINAGSAFISGSIALTIGIIIPIFSWNSNNFLGICGGGILTTIGILELKNGWNELRSFD